jgi:hypothetical protein
MRTLILAIFLIVTATAALAEGGGFALPAELALVLPRSGKVTAEWLLPPLGTDEVKRAALSGQRFRLDRQAAIWMLHGRKYLTNLGSGQALTLARPVNDFIWLDDGGLFLASENALGIIPPLGPGKTPALTPFQPVISLPAQQCLLATDGKNAIFAYGYDPALQGYALFELVSGFAGWRQLFAATDKISDVCVDGQTLYISTGRSVYRLRRGDAKSIVAFVHPLDNITGLACGSGNGPFFSTARGVGVISGAGVEFIKSNWTQLGMRDDALYLFMPESLGVLRLNDTGKMLEKSE